MKAVDSWHSASDVVIFCKKKKYILLFIYLLILIYLFALLLFYFIEFCLFICFIIWGGVCQGVGSEFVQLLFVLCYCSHKKNQ